jgi:cold shock CspA family protein
MSMHRGVVVQFNAQAGYDFLRSSSDTKDVFVHISAVSNGETLRLSQRVLFSTELFERGLWARKLRLVVK